MKTSKKIEQQMLRKSTVKLKMRVMHRSIVNSDFKVKIQAGAAKQTDKFEYFIKETEEYFVKNEDSVRCYMVLPGFDVLDTTFCFVSPFVSQKSKALILFQEFVVVLVKLRLNSTTVLAFRFGVSLSRAFTAWLTVMGEFFHKTKQFVH